MEVNSPTTLALKSSVFLKANEGTDNIGHKKKKHVIQANVDIKKSSRIAKVVPCPRDGATLTT